MNLENEMYRVMAAFCSGGIPVDFKGAMVLHAFLYENGFIQCNIICRDRSAIHYFQQFISIEEFNRLPKEQHKALRTKFVGDQY